MEARAALDARIAVRRAAQSLRPGAMAVRQSCASTRQPVAVHLSAAATCLAAGRDLLHTHFADPMPGDGGSLSVWAEALVSRSVTHALASEVGRLAAQLAPWISRVALEGPADPAMPPIAGLALHSAGRWLWIAAASVEAASRRQPPSPEGRPVLAAIPANLLPPLTPVSGQETLAELCDGVIITAERLRQAAAAFARRARWSAQATSQSWRRDALASAITGHGSELILHGLAHRAAGLGMSPAVQTQLHHAAGLLHRAWTTWRAVTGAWDTLSTGLDRPKGLSLVAAEAGGLVLRIGRIAYRNPGWTPTSGNASRTREPADLAPDVADLRAVVASVHHATDAITRIADQDSRCVHDAFAQGWLYLPTRLLPGDYDIPYRYTPAPLFKAQPLLTSYTLAVEACTAASAALDELALAVEAPSRTLAWARRLASVDQRYPRPPDGPWHPGPRSAAVPHPGRIEHSLRDLKINDPDLLTRAATIDEAARVITAEATIKATRAEIMTDATAQSASRAQHASGRRPPRAHA
jgi:hypothetical protein